MTVLEKQNIRRKKKRIPKVSGGNSFEDQYKLTGERLGKGSCGTVESCISVYTGVEYAVKIIEVGPATCSRRKILKEIEVYYLCRGHPNVIQLIEYFEENSTFYLVFEKVFGGTLQDQLDKRIFFSEDEVRNIIKELVEAIKHLHDQGIAHRDIKPDNILCVSSDSPYPIKLCDFDLCSQPRITDLNPELLTPVGTIEFMAPEVVNTFIYDDDDDDDDLEMTLSYDKKCDLWSVGVIMFILLSGKPPFSGQCGSDCGWDQGQSCKECQQSLFSAIRDGKVRPYEGISSEAKVLIQNLLMQDSAKRLDVNQVLSHPWILGNEEEMMMSAVSTPVTILWTQRRIRNRIWEDDNTDSMKSDQIRNRIWNNDNTDSMGTDQIRNRIWEDDSTESMRSLC